MADAPPLRFTGYVERRMQQRGLDRAWVERVAREPEWTEPDPQQPGVARAFGRVPEAGGRVLRVAYADRGGERVLISAHFDRRRTRRGRR